MNRTHLITDTQIQTILSELRNLKQNSIICPDTDASYTIIRDILSSISGT